MIWSWITLALLGAWHGVNPAMGWLFAVSRGLQERRSAAVTGSLPPIALGHALSILAVFALFAAGRMVLDWRHLRFVTAAIVVIFGISKLVRHRHPRWVGMRVGFRDLLLWSFLMATAHGAGLMLIPLLVIGGAPVPSCHAHAGLALSGPGAYLGAAAVHTAAMLLATGLIALIVYHRLGLGLLRRTWFNLDWLWAVALIVSGAATILIA